MMKITGLSHLFKWENLHNWWLTKYFCCPTVYIYIFWLPFIICAKHHGCRKKVDEQTRYTLILCITFLNVCAYLISWRLIQKKKMICFLVPVAQWKSIE